jgi:hypothetical protein
MAYGEEQLERPDRGHVANEWNELDFVPWQAFRRMAPSILNLELNRLADLMAQAQNLEYRNALVRARYELEAFVAAFEESVGQPQQLPLARLQAAIVNLPIEYPEIGPEAQETLAYILDRLQYVHTRIRFVYQ